MKSMKTEFRFFSVPEWKKEEEYLREQHKKRLEIRQSVRLLCLSF